MNGWQDRYAPTDRKIVKVLWWDASQARGETITADGPSASYSPGVVDEVVGYLVGETEDWLILSDSYQADNVMQVHHRDFRSIRNIPKSIVCKVVELVPQVESKADVKGVSDGQTEDPSLHVPH